MSAFFTYNEVQTSFHVFENSLESIFVYDSDYFSNFWLQFINSLRRIPVYNILNVSPETVVPGSQVWGNALAMKSVHLFPSIVQESFCPNIILLHWHSARAHHPLGILCFLDSLESLGSKKYRSLLLNLLPVTFPFSKN